MAGDNHHLYDIHHADYDEEQEEDYIDMEVGSCKNFVVSPTQDFEFQMFSSSSERDTTTSPADELFYKGKLLPLHIPPRLKMVEKLLQNSKRIDNMYDEFFSTPPSNTNYTTPENNTPFESCNISPLESCQISRELNPGEYMLDYSDDVIDEENLKKSWTKKLKLIKQLSFGSKLKASQAYLKGLFGKSTSKVNFEKKEICSSQLSTSVVKRSFKQEKIVDVIGGRHRRSFSTAIKRLSTVKPSSSSSSSSSSTSYHSTAILTRSISSRNSETENSIESAIAHCKNSQQQQIHSRKTLIDVGFCALSAKKIVYEDYDRQGICRG